MIDARYRTLQGPEHKAWAAPRSAGSSRSTSDCTTSTSSAGWPSRPRSGGTTG